MEEKYEDIWPLRYYGELKKKTYGAVLLFPRGDFYYMYYEDAYNVAKATGITLSRSNGGSGHYVAAIPQKSLDGYLLRIVKAGLTVAICDDKSVKDFIKED